MDSIAWSILHFAETTPDKIALYTAEETCTYARLARLARQTAAWLAEKGVRAGDRVVVESAHTLAYVALCYGAHLHRAVFVPLEGGVPTARLREVAGEVEASLVITREPRGDLPAALGVAEVWQAVQLVPTDAPLVPPAPDELVEILFTTGTTGKSKGVMVGARCQTTMADGGIELIHLRDDDVWLIPTPMNHAAGLRKMHMCMRQGCSVCLLDGFRDMKRFFDTIARVHATALYLPPSAIHVLIALAPREMAALDGQLRFIYSSSAAYPQADKVRIRALMPHVRMYNAYGASETGIVCALDINSSADKPGSVGRPHSLSRIVIVDGDRRVLADSSPQNSGAIAAISDSVMLGYWREPELTRQALVDGMLILSDIGYIDADGDVILLGRGDDVINVGGLKVAPTEVEEVALALSGVDECVCIPDAGRGVTRLKLIVVMKPDAAFDAAALTAALAAKLEDYKVPALIEQSDAPLARTFNGKLDRRRIIAANQR